MGISKSTALHINFHRPNLCYTAGERIIGIISFNNIRKKFILNKVFIELIGELGYTIQKIYTIHDGIGHSQIEHRTIYQKTPFISIRHPIIYSRDTENEIILYQGQYSWPFEFILPQSLPPSSNTSYSYIKYYVRIMIDKPWYKSNLKRIFPLIIFPNVDLFNIHEGQQSVTLFRRNRNNLQIKIYLYHRGILPEQNISFNIDIKNPERLKIKNIQALLIQHRQIAQNHNAEIIFQINLPDLLNFNETELHRTFNLQIPDNQLSPTYNYTVQYSDSSIPTDIHYELKLVVKIIGILTDMEFTIPIIVATKSSLEQFQLQRNSTDTEIPIAYADTLKEIDLPPTYESVIANFKSEQLTIL